MKENKEEKMKKQKTKRIYAPSLIPNLHGRNNSVMIAYNKDGRFEGTGEYQNMTRTMQQNPGLTVIKKWQNAHKYQEILTRIGIWNVI